LVDASGVAAGARAGITAGSVVGVDVGGTVAADVGTAVSEGVAAVDVGVAAGSLVMVVYGAAVAGGATKPSAVVAMASVAKTAESRLLVSPMDIPFFVLRVMHPTGAEQVLIHRLEDFVLRHASPNEKRPPTDVDERFYVSKFQREDPADV
jgi:hypothetical protein